MLYELHNRGVGLAIGSDGASGGTLATSTSADIAKKNAKMQEKKVETH